MTVDKIYSQNSEQLVILEYFKGRDISDITLLDIGANSELLSNTYALTTMGAKSLLVEPSKEAYNRLCELHRDREDVVIMNVAISHYCGKALMQESGSHLGKGDVSLLSTLNKSDYDKWKHTTEFKEVEVDVIDVRTMIERSPYKKFNFISIDCEGLDFTVLIQLGLTELECEILCIEYNGDEYLEKKIIEGCAKHGLTNLLLKNQENLILSR